MASPPPNGPEKPGWLPVPKRASFGVPTVSFSSSSTIVFAEAVFAFPNGLALAPNGLENCPFQRWHTNLRRGHCRFLQTNDRHGSRDALTAATFDNVFLTSQFGSYFPQPKISDFGMLSIQKCSSFVIAGADSLQSWQSRRPAKIRSILNCTESSTPTVRGLASHWRLRILTDLMMIMLGVTRSYLLSM